MSGAPRALTNMQSILTAGGPMPAPRRSTVLHRRYALDNSGLPHPCKHRTATGRTKNDPMSELVTPLIELTTPRLRLRQWRASDLEPFAALNADPVVMALMPRCLTSAESDAMARAAQAGLTRQGWGLWATELRESGELIGSVGLGVPAFETHFTPCVEVMWRLRRESWGLGFATEAARECLRCAFEQLALPEVVAFTVPANIRSRAVMERLGMRHDASGDFEHPRLAVGHPLRPHVLYRLSREEWEGSATSVL